MVVVLGEYQSELFVSEVGHTYLIISNIRVKNPDSTSINVIQNDVYIIGTRHLNNANAIPEGICAYNKLDI